MTKPTKWHVCPVKTKISLGIRPVWSEYSLSAWRNFGSLATQWAHYEDSDQTWRMPRLIWVFAVCTATLLFCHEAAHLWGAVKNSITRLSWGLPSISDSYTMWWNFHLTHISLVDYSSLIYWMNPFPILGVAGEPFHFYSISNRNSCKRTLKTLIRRRVLQRLIWVCTVCLCPKKGTLGLNGLIHQSFVTTAHALPMG